MADVELTETQIDHIAERAAEKALEKVYMEVGKSVVRKLTWLAGIVTISLLIYLAGKGAISTGGVP